jgi:hypothetical protein
VSRPGVYECAGIQSDFFPGCATDDVLEGYTFATGLFPTTMTIDVLSKADYLHRLEAMFASVDASYSDEHGGGRPTVVGVKKCGGDWNITWTAAISEPGAPAERMGANLGFVLEDVGSDEWFTEGLWLTPLRYPGSPAFESEMKLDDIACKGPTSRWPS